MSAVAGDAASCSRVGGSLRRLAASLRTEARAVDAVVAQAREEPRPGAVVVRSLRRAGRLGDAAAAAAHELDRVGSVLQDHAADLAEAVADARRLEARAEAAGLRVVDGVVAPVWGVSGLADVAATADREQVRAELQRELDQLRHVLAARRQRLASAVTASTDVLAGHADGLRR
ncbi:hypothetical protein [Phycicoccus sp. Soil748]|uniref:hypothetical protein n=1 Tax=Intrasporangiaceae TaxID=85021 RepID=UPI0007033B0A|nr:hypothetical protein [Phycicoccus sp. Soil748]KRE57201.1 hypothetical protein ASG70_01900 [Phycicoccus sp. Soil748]